MHDFHFPGLEGSGRVEDSRGHQGFAVVVKQPSHAHGIQVVGIQATKAGVGRGKNADIDAVPESIFV